jgi:hypothetical protein
MCDVYIVQVADDSIPIFQSVHEASSSLHDSIPVSLRPNAGEVHEASSSRPGARNAGEICPERKPATSEDLSAGQLQAIAASADGFQRGPLREASSSFPSACADGLQRGGLRDASSSSSPAVKLIMPLPRCLVRVQTSCKEVYIVLVIYGYISLSTY